MSDAMLISIVDLCRTFLSNKSQFFRFHLVCKSSFVFHNEKECRCLLTLSDVQFLG